MSLKPLLNLITGRPILAAFEICLRCNSACGYCDLPLNTGRHEMTREEIRRVFGGLYKESDVTYSAALRLKGWVPAFVSKRMVHKGLKDVTTWLREQAEARASNARPSHLTDMPATPR